MRKTIYLLAIILVLIGCQKIDYFPDSLFYYPTCFTPNKDGVNDTWQPSGGLEKDSIYAVPNVNFDTYLLKILNKNNKVLYEIDAIYPGWDGTYKGDTCPYDFYYYRVSYESLEGKKYSDAGMLELLR
ncbi:MAG: T9SS type B sorting domain-containing protein [Bacteroidales bacterium]|nr:T9SS type B sorting domain-containing protein [Bacteroidales bacterium]